MFVTVPFVCCLCVGGLYPANWIMGLLGKTGPVPCRIKVIKCIAAMSHECYGILHNWQFYCLSNHLFKSTHKGQVMHICVSGLTETSLAQIIAWHQTGTKPLFETIAGVCNKIADHPDVV